MTAVGKSQQGAVRRVGVRAYAEVELAAESLTAPEAGRDRSPHFSAGASAAYRWAAGRAHSSPVTGASAPGKPDLHLLTAEVDAAVVQLDDRTGQDSNREYVRGAHDALAWVCGYSDQLA
ncbi:hypothetical protein ACFQ2B_02465 [Streptomyces stramineus]|uniref:hypothetical protein n=1 Tax=Streptomyces TaxID=1883 RepID=UPI0031E20CFA